jgi:hypothetical protein
MIAGRLNHSYCLCWLVRSERTYLELVCRLVEIYWTCTDARLHGVLQRETYIRDISLGTCSRALLFAACACSVKYSIHILVKGPARLISRRNSHSALGTKFTRLDGRALSLVMPRRTASSLTTPCIKVTVAAPGLTYVRNYHTVTLRFK